MPTLTPITNKQKLILSLLFNYRFLNRKQIQNLLQHNDKKRTIEWLRDLKEKEYIDWIYDASNFATKSQPATYFLSLNGIRWLRSQDGYPAEELRKRYKEATRTPAFIDRCIRTADYCFELESRNSEVAQYTYATPSVIYSNDEYGYLSEISPHLHFSKRVNGSVSTYLLEDVAPNLPRYQLRSRLGQYVRFVTEEWPDDEDGNLIVLFLCATTADLMYIKRKLNALLDECEFVRGSFRVATREKVKKSGFTGKVWEDV